MSTYFAGINSPYIKKVCREIYGSDNHNTIVSAFKREIQTLLNVNCKIFVCGDLNSRHRLWNCNRANAIGNVLYDTLRVRQNSHIYYPQSPTFISRRNITPSTLDLVLTNHIHPVIGIQTVNDLGSDHLPIEFQIPSQITFVTPNNYIFDYKLADWRKFKQEINSKIDLVDLQHRLSQIDSHNQENYDVIINEFNNVLIDSRDIAVPKKLFNTFRVSRELPQHILVLKTARNRLRRRWQQYRQTNDSHNIKIMNKLINKKIQEHKNSQFEQYLAHINTNDNDHNKKLWKVSKYLRRKTTAIQVLKQTSTGQFLLTDKEKTEELASSFLDAHKLTLDFSDRETVNDVEESVQTLYEQIIIENSAYRRPKEDENIVKLLKSRKAPGFDNITNNLVKHIPRKGIVFLSYLFTSLIRNNYFPNVWKLAKIIPIAKPEKDLTLAKSYRPVSLLPTLGKIFEKILLRKINKFIQEHEEENPGQKIIPNHQFGFRALHSCNHQVYRLVQSIKRNRSNQISTGLIAMDVEKAFDTIWHDALIHKMIKLEFPMSLIKIIKSFLMKRKFKVCYGSANSNEHIISAGVPQGSVLSPTLFSIYIADIPRIENVEIANFADDTILYSSHLYGADIINNLENSYRVMWQYFKKWKIKINNEKTRAIYFTRKRKSIFKPNRNLSLNNSDIAWDTKLKYLGIVLDPKLTFRDHVEYTLTKINKMTRALYSLLNRRSTLFINKKLLLYRTIIQPIMMYGCPNWSMCAAVYYKKIQIQQNKILKLITNKPIRFSTSRLHQLTNITTIREKVQNQNRKFKNSIQLSENPLIRSLE